MTRTLIIILAATLLMSCGSSKYFISNEAEFSTLSSLLKKLDKNKNDNQEIRDQIVELYQSSSKRLLNDIDVYKTLTGPDKWDKVIKAYQTLNTMSEVIIKSKAGNFITPDSYHGLLSQAKQEAAGDYYDAANETMKGGDKASFREAYYLFSKANGYYPGYRDVKRKMEFAWKESVLNVVINPVTDQSSYYAQMIPNRFGNSFNSDLLQRTLVRDLGGDFNKRAPARFYTDYEARVARVDIDWIADITWTRLDIPIPFTQSSTVRRTKDIEIKKDTLGKPVYQKVEATLKITRRYFTAYGEVECRMTDAHTRENIALDRYPSRIDWSQSYATYSGDKRALTDADWAMINNRVVIPTREAVLMELYQKIYPQLKNGIRNLVQ